LAGPQPVRRQRPAQFVGDATVELDTSCIEAQVAAVFLVVPVEE